MRCVACGSTNLVEGTVPQTPKEDITFHTGGRSFKERVLGGGRKVGARGCLRRNHLQFAVDFEPGGVGRYQEFEGGQPTVLERLEGAAEHGEWGDRPRAQQRHAPDRE